MALQITMMAPLRYSSTLPLSLSVLIAEISFCFSSQVYVVYLGSKNSYSPDVISSQNHQMLVAVHGGSVEKARLSHVYSYRHGFRGFAAKLTDEQALAMSKMPGVVSVFPNLKRSLHTTHSWDFMGLMSDESMEMPGYSTKNQQNVIIGFIDTGSNMPCTPQAIDVLRKAKVLIVPEKAASAGGTEKNVRDLFADAENDQWTPGDQSDLHVIIFDEIDAICKGYFLGNPVTDERYDNNSVVPYAHGMGLISDELYESAKKSCEGDYINPRNPKCAKDVEAVDECTSRISEGYILDPKCPLASPRPSDMVRHRRSLKEKSEELLLPYPQPQFGCREYVYLLSDYWANDDSVRKALGICQGTTREWQRCNHDIHYEKNVNSTIKYHLNLTTRGYPALIYSGDHDLLVPFLGTQAWIRSLNFSIVDEWRPWFVDGQVAGYTRTYLNNLTFATLKGAGHTAPEYKPKEGLAMFQRWISGNPL